MLLLVRGRLPPLSHMPGQGLRIEKQKVQAVKTNHQKSTLEKAFGVEEVRTKHKDAYKPWTPALDDELTAMYCEGLGLAAIAKHFRRTKGAILSRIKKLELEDFYG